jgi:hypothetical protein
MVRTTAADIAAKWMKRPAQVRERIGAEFIALPYSADLLDELATIASEVRPGGRALGKRGGPAVTFDVARRQLYRRRYALGCANMNFALDRRAEILKGQRHATRTERRETLSALDEARTALAAAYLVGDPSGGLEAAIKELSPPGRKRRRAEAIVEWVSAMASIYKGASKLEPTIARPGDPSVGNKPNSRFLRFLQAASTSLVPPGRRSAEAWHNLISRSKRRQLAT